jgi:hypothetical protein
VTNIDRANVTECLKGSTSPSTVITDGITFPIGIAFARKGDMFASNRSGGSGTNAEVRPPGGSSPSRSIADGITEPRGIAVDAKGTLCVTNLAYDTVTEYLAGQGAVCQTIAEGPDNPSPSMRPYSPPVPARPKSSNNGAV